MRWTWWRSPPILTTRGLPQQAHEHRSVPSPKMSTVPKAWKFLAIWAIIRGCLTWELRRYHQVQIAQKPGRPLNNGRGPVELHDRQFLQVELHSRCCYLHEVGIDDLCSLRKELWDLRNWPRSCLGDLKRIIIAAMVKFKEKKIAHDDDQANLIPNG
jgi:hypothetical protein